MNLRSAGFLLALVTLQLAPSVGTIGGIVIKAGTTIQQPLLNARLELSGGPGPVRVLRTDATGRFVFYNLAPGEYRLAVTCDGFIRQESANNCRILKPVTQSTSQYSGNRTITWR